MNTEINNASLKEAKNFTDFSDEKADNAEPLPEGVQDGSSDSEKGCLEFTQEQVNKIVAKEAAKAVEKALRELGFEGSGKAKEQISMFKAKLEQDSLAKNLLESQLLEARESLLKAEHEYSQSKIAAMLAFGGVNKESSDTAVKLVTNLIQADFTPDEAVLEVLSRYPHLKTTPQELPQFSVSTTNVEDKFGAIKNIFKSNAAR